MKKERNGETRCVIRSETEEKNFFSDSYTFPGIKSFEEIQNTLRLHASESVLKEQKGVIYPTITPSEKKLKVNGQTANKIIEYKKIIDYSQEIHVTL
ncbi:hypothetical protein GIX45_17725 [Erwinia sp. CPCC 100877]|nr:hypothetical protein [Erwinia sp. CPCC 100877]